MKTVIAGSRNVTNKTLVFECIEKSKLAITEVVSGCAKGVDSLGELYAFRHGLQITPFWADWRIHGKAAGPIRNREMAEYADQAIILWNGESSGTRNMIECMRSLGKDFVLFDCDGTECQYDKGNMVHINKPRHNKRRNPCQTNILTS